ncbi:DUF732 domain-containing protein [Mycobacterium servetii]|uniref:DUF732 domain-containing protein n=1 Tax=Mycobacterium servetii TaxID=3237418 RepID=A0ABV4C2X2_9MYCO
MVTGHAVCTGLQWLQCGMPQPRPASNTNTAPAQAQSAVDAAITAYCPQYRR